MTLTGYEALFFWIFGIGAIIAGYLAGKLEMVFQVRMGIGITFSVALVRVLLHLLLGDLPIALQQALLVAAAIGAQLAFPVLTLRMLDLFPAARGTAAGSQRLHGRTVEVLVDGVSRKNAADLSGRTRCNRVVNFERQGRVAIGDIAHVRVTDVLPHSLRGALATPEEAVCSSR